jgi:hypothetical protein
MLLAERVWSYGHEGGIHNQTQVTRRFVFGGSFALISPPNPTTSSLTLILAPNLNLPNPIPNPGPRDESNWWIT